VQLAVLHLRSNLLLLGLWLVLAGFISGNLGYKLGFQYLFLDPEYLGEVNFWSFFFLGLAFGGFFMTWSLTSYLLTAHHFPFLASLSRPFTKYSINNLLLPALFFGYFLAKLMHFQRNFQRWAWDEILLLPIGMITGALVLILLYTFYFRFTNRDISHYTKGKPNPSEKVMTPGRRDMEMDVVQLDAKRIPVETYLTERFRWRRVRRVAHYDAELLRSVFRQNHLNALSIQLMTLILLMFLGWLIDYPTFQIPAGASIFIMCSVFTALIGAINYWFHNWRNTIIIVLLLLVNFLTSFRTIGHRNQAYGLDYESPPVSYAQKVLLGDSLLQRVRSDKQATERILDRWRYRLTGSLNAKPKLVIIAVSGGGLRSATWTMKVVQHADSLLDGRLMDHAALVTGASGGLIGMGYYRELYLREQSGDSLCRMEPFHIDRITQDLLNPIAFTLTTNDLFLPWGKFEAGGYTYRKDRGYVFERTLNANVDGLLDKPLADYRAPEQAGLIPLLFITPSIVNDARRLIISAQGASYMMLPPVGVKRPRAVEADAVDFQWLFEDHQADNLRFLSALRMNATYPYVLPTVHLPTEPEIEVLDAGFRDNYGLLSATRFIQVFRKWIRENTSGVVLVQISSSQKVDEIEESDREGIVESLINPLGIATQVLNLQEYEQDNTLGFIYDMLGPDRFHHVRFEYHAPSQSKVHASISFHITEREKNQVMQALQRPENQSSLRQLEDLLRPARN